MTKQMCPGCYRKNIEGYCRSCRQQLFDGAKVSPILPFDAPQENNLADYQAKTKRLSISGVQLKYSLQRDGNQLKLTDTGGRYIIKPIPPTTQIAQPGQAPENEHLTMQIAAQIFGIKTAANALMYFKDGLPAYITRRFDVKQDGNKFLQEDMAQLSGRSRQVQGENFKYEGTYEEIGQLIRQYVAAYPPALEDFFCLVLFNYLFSNGDAHLKNFSLLQSTMNDYGLSPAYDLMSTVLHMPNETDTALDLYEGDINHPFYARYGFFGQLHFRELANRVGIIPVRRNRILTRMLTRSAEVEKMVLASYLSDEYKTKYINAYYDKLKRMGMTGQMIGTILNPEHPGVYAVTHKVTQLQFLDGSTKTGYFNPTRQMDQLEENNKFTFVELSNKDNANTYITIDADELVKVEFPVTEVWPY